MWDSPDALGGSRGRSPAAGCGGIGAPEPGLLGPLHARRPPPGPGARAGRRGDGRGCLDAALPPALRPPRPRSVQHPRRHVQPHRPSRHGPAPDRAEAVSPAFHFTHRLWKGGGRYGVGGSGRRSRAFASKRTAETRPRVATSRSWSRTQSPPPTPPPSPPPSPAWAPPSASPPTSHMSTSTDLPSPASLAQSYA